jgi:nucleoside-diphosphate-sugar epimerase
MAYFSFTNDIMAGKPINIFQGPGGTELGRDFTYVDDIVAGNIAALDKAGPNGHGTAPCKVRSLIRTGRAQVSEVVSYVRGA